MTEMLKAIWKSQQRLLVIFLAFVTIFGLYLYFNRPLVKDKNDLIEIKGTLKKINKVLIRYGKLNKTERDSTLHFYLQEYPCKFQVSYFPYDKNQVFKTASFGDNITFQISKDDSDRLMVNNERIRSFSLKVNDITFVTVESGISGFGKGYFELGLIIISIIINILVIRVIIERKKSAQQKI